MASLKKRDDVIDFFRGERFHDAVGKEEGVVLACLHLILVYYRLHDIHV